MKDILVYLMEFSSPSQIYVIILIPISGFQRKLHSPSLEMLFISHPPLSECAEFWSPLPDIFHAYAIKGNEPKMEHRKIAAPF